MMEALSLNSSALFTWRAILAQLLVAVLSLLVWRRYLSPLADIPGPAVASLSRWWHIRRIFVGDQNLQLFALHQKHGTCLFPPFHRGFVAPRRPY